MYIFTENKSKPVKGDLHGKKKSDDREADHIMLDGRRSHYLNIRSLLPLY